MSTRRFRNVDLIFDDLKGLLSIKKDVELASALGIEPGKLGVWKTRNFVPTELIISLCREKGLDVFALLYGDEAPTGLDRARRLRETITLQKKTDEFLAHGQDFVYVPLIRGQIKAGLGALADNHIETVLAFRQDWMRRKGDPSKMLLVQVTGDSMESTLFAGDLLLVDLSHNHIDPMGGIYAITIGDETMVKRLQYIYPDGGLKVISDNREKYEAFTVDANQVIINGKVIWFGRELER